MRDLFGNVFWGKFWLSNLSNRDGDVLGLEPALATGMERFLALNPPLTATNVQPQFLLLFTSSQ